MAITFENLGGVGINVTYAVLRDGKRIAILKRSGRRDNWGIYSHYHRALWLGPNVAAGKRAAAEITYPTKEEIYETICQEVEKARRIKLEETHAHTLFRLTREMVAGSNSARIELEELLAMIEREATDRTATSIDREIKTYTNWRETCYPEEPK